MNQDKNAGYAPLKKRVILPALLAIMLLALGVCALHGENVISLRGMAKLSDYAWLETTGETLNLPAEDGKERIHALYQDGDKAFALHISDPWADGGVMHMEGALLRMDQTIGEVKVRVGLIPERLDGEGGMQEEVMLLNTQMVRRYDYARAYGVDDHCGFKATVETRRLLGDGWQYRVVLADETDGAMRMFDTGMTVAPIEGGLAFMRVNQPEGEAQHAQ